MSQADSPAGRPEYHRPVMITEVVDLFRPLGSGLVVDATYGGGGHTRALLDALPGIVVLGIDRDPDARPKEWSHARFRFAAGRFSELASLVARESDELPFRAGDGRVVSGVLFDFGVSSHQLDTAARGFSFRNKGPLDMRMDPAERPSAFEIVNAWPMADLAEVISRWGQEPQARRIASAIVAARPIVDTVHLAETIADAMPAAVRRRRHPARRAFQGIRMAVNDEAAEIEGGLEAAISLVRPGGRIAAITYHSIEDRLVKRRFASGTQGCECPPDLPVCVCGRTAELRSLTRRGLTPSDQEIEDNRRARSARLRAVERIAA